MRIRVLAYNIHKAIGLDRKFNPEPNIAVLRHHDADIVTRCTLNCTLGSNHGTGCGYPNLADRLETFIGPIVTHVDAGHTVTSQNGSVFRTYHTLRQGIANAADGAILSLVAGDYPADGSPLIAGANGRSAIRQAPVGVVRIGG